jgi:ferredoxin-type protein NapG
MPDPDPEPSSADRRTFFRRLLLRGLNEAEERGKAVTDKVKAAFTPISPRSLQLGIPDTASAPAEELDALPSPIRVLRPPGALPESLFDQTCSRCGECVKACPAQCIVLDPEEAGGLPWIEARKSPCVVCSDLSCMKICPTGALKLVGSASQIDMGFAEVDHTRCLRSPRPGAPRGEDCRLCVTSCPFGEIAIGIDVEDRVAVRDGCVGCGVCERACPTEPASIWVVSKEDSEPTNERGEDGPLREGTVPRGH